MAIEVSRLGPAAQRQILQKLRDQEAKVNKYHAKPAERQMPNGTTHTFASQKEARRYDELALLLKVGKIRNLRLQPQYTITESYISADGERIRAHRYTADFAYDCDGAEIVEDVKSSATRTRDYINNVKALAQRGIYVREV